MQSAHSAQATDDTIGESAARRGFHQRPWFVLVLFALVGFAIYAPALNGEKVWDDHYLIGENPLFRSPAFAGEVFKQHLFFESLSTYYRPVQNLSYIADYWVWAENPVGFHITNVGLHVIAAWLLWSLLGRIVPGLGVRGSAVAWIAFSVGLIWLVHPIHNAAVAYISGRADSLAAVFSLSAWIVLLQAEAILVSEGTGALKRGILCVVSAAFLLLALCSKEIALVWLLLFTIHRIAFTSGVPKGRRFLPIIGAVALLAVYVWLHSLPPERAPQPVAIAGGIGGRAIVALRALGDYTGLIFVPWKLMMERSLDPVPSSEGWLSVIGSEWRLMLGIVALLVGGWLVLKRDGDCRLRRFGAMWFVVAFIPISNLIPLNAQVAEHWIYLASIGALLFIAGCVSLLPQNARSACVVGSIVAAAVLGVRTGFRAADWADAETFARKTIESGGVTARMLAYLAQELGAKRKYAEQEMTLRRAITLFPDYATARVNLALCLERQGKSEEAKALLRPESGSSVQAAAPTVPRSWNAALNLASALHKEKQSDTALKLLREWRDRYPDTWELAAEEATILGETVGPEAAADVIRGFADKHWWHLPSHLGLAGYQRQTGALDTARSTVLEAMELDIHGAEAYAELARIEAGSGRFEAAIDAAATAVSRRPKNPDYYELLAGLLEATGRREDAAVLKRKADALRR